MDLPGRRAARGQGDPPSFRHLVEPSVATSGTEATEAEAPRMWRLPSLGGAGWMKLEFFFSGTCFFWMKLYIIIYIRLESLETNGVDCPKNILHVCFLFRLVGKFLLNEELLDKISDMEVS